MTNLAMWALIVGFFLPVVISIIVQTSWTTALKASVAFVVCLIAGAGTAYFAGDLDGKDWITASLMIMVTALTTYSQFWKKTGIAPKLESATSASSTPPPSA